MMRANFAGADRVLGALGAHPISSDQPKNQAVIDVVHEMALAARIPEPRVEVIDDPSPNAFAVGRDPEHSAICVTQGLLDQMDREELQGVIGHETAHIRDYDTRLTTMVTAMFGGLACSASSSVNAEVPRSSRIISRMLSREREYLADASAVELTRNPTALIRALEHIAKTESPLRCATPGTAQLFIVDPFERAGGATSYKQYINEITRIRLQPGKTQEDRDEEARKFAINEYPRNMLAEKLSSHPPLGERIERLQALIGAAPGAAAASGLTDDQLRAKFSESAKFVRNLANTDPEVMARIMASALLALPAGRMLLQEKFGCDTQIYPRIDFRVCRLRAPRAKTLRIKPGIHRRFDLAPNEGGASSLSPPSAADPASGKANRPARFDSRGSAAGRGPREDACSGSGIDAAEDAAPRPAAAERPTGSLGIFLFWIVIAFSAGAIVASFAIK